MEKRYLILDKGGSRVSKFTLIDIFDNWITNIVVAQNKKSFDGELNVFHETYMGAANIQKLNQLIIFTF